MHLRIEEIGELLDPLVVRERSLRRSRSEVIEERVQKSLRTGDLQKALTFDVTRIQDYDPNQPQTEHVPYLLTEDGRSFVPYSVEHWEEQGQPPEFYETTRRFYRETRVGREDNTPVRFMESPVADVIACLRDETAQVSNVLRAFREQVEDRVQKASFATSGGVPLGTVHQYRDGNWYRKVAPGEWKLVSQAKGTQKPDDITKEGHAKIEDHLREKKILGALDRRLKGKVELQTHTEGMKKELLAQVHAALAEHAQPGAKPEEGKPKVAAKPEEKQAAAPEPVKGKGQPKEESPEGKSAKPVVEPGGETDGGTAPLPNQATGDDSLPKQFGAGEGDVTFSTLRDGDVDRAVARTYRREFRQHFLEVGAFMPTLVDLGARGACHRLKATKSLLDKMKTEKMKDRSLNTLTDMIGGRAVMGNYQEQRRVVNYLRTHFKVVEHEDFVEKGRGDGYRAVHLLLRTEGGRIFEFQAKTINQQYFSGFFHDVVYKGDEKVKKSPEVAKFARQVSDYLARMDRGEGKTEKELGPVPKTPPELTRALKEKRQKLEGAGKKQAAQAVPLDFPWDLVASGEMGEEWLKKAQEKGKKMTGQAGVTDQGEGQEGGGHAAVKKPATAYHYFVLTRKNGKTVACQEYLEGERALAAADRFERAHPDWEFPVVSAPDERTLYAVFPEYRLEPEEEEAGGEEGVDEKAVPVKKAFERYRPHAHGGT